MKTIKSWNGKTNTLTYDESIYNVNNSTWIRDYSYPQQQIPSAQEKLLKYSLMNT